MLAMRTFREFRFVVKQILATNNCYELSAKKWSHYWSNTKAIIDEQLESIRSAGTWKVERVITSKQDSRVNVIGQSKQVINCCANNYLGLSSHPEVINAGIEALRQYGAGLSSVRFICGTQHLHKQLESKISQFHAREDAILYACCFDANAGIFEALLTPQDAIISDELNHASIVDGIRLCKAERHRYKHRDVDDLRRILIQTERSRTRLIATDGVFSMDGNVAPLDKICDLADKYNAIVFVDDCHATGFFGKTGRGTEEYFGLTGKVDIINSTLGKALGGSAGGYTTGRQELIDLLRQRSRPYLFSNSLPPAVVASAISVFDMLMNGSSLTEKLTQNTELFRRRMKSAGFNILGDEHPICPVFIGDAKLAVLLADRMLEKGIYCIGFSYPVVPKGKARVRVQISAAHSTDDINAIVDAFIDAGKQLNVI